MSEQATPGTAVARFRARKQTLKSLFDLELTSYYLLVGTVTLLLVVLVIGSSHNGNKNWLIIGPLTVQPSEFAKLALVLWGADLLVRKEKLLKTWDHLLVPLVPGAVLIIGLVMIGGDMGTSMIIVAIVFALLWTAGAPFQLFSILLSSAGGLAALP